MSSAELATVTGISAVCAQGLISWLIHRSPQPYFHTQPAVLSDDELLPIVLPHCAAFKPKRQQHRDRLLSLGFLTLLLYGVLGARLATMSAGLSIWLVAILVYHWNLIQLELALIPPMLQQILQTLSCGAIAAIITQLLSLGKPGLPTHLAIAMGLAIAINSLILTKSFIEVQRQQRSLLLSNTLAGLGLLLGWIVCQTIH
jgi:hypothetical protein